MDNSLIDEKNVSTIIQPVKQGHFKRFIEEIRSRKYLKYFFERNIRLDVEVGGNILWNHCRRKPKEQTH